METTDRNKESWFSALVAFEFIVPKTCLVGRHFEVRAFLLRAATEDAARKKAGQLGRGEQHKYRNAFGERVAWRFKEVLDICNLAWLDALNEGSQVYYAYVGAKSLGEIRRALHRKLPENVVPTRRRKRRRQRF